MLQRDVSYSTWKEKNKKQKKQQIILFIINRHGCCHRLVAQINRKQTATEIALSLEKTQDLCKAQMQI